MATATIRWRFPSEHERQEELRGCVDLYVYTQLALGNVGPEGVDLVRRHAEDHYGRYQREVRPDLPHLRPRVRMPWP